MLNLLSNPAITWHLSHVRCDQGCCQRSVCPGLMREWGTIALRSCPVSDLGYPHRHAASPLVTTDGCCVLIGWSLNSATTSRVNERQRCIAHRRCPGRHKWESDEWLSSSLSLENENWVQVPDTFYCWRMRWDISVGDLKTDNLCMSARLFKLISSLKYRNRNRS